ncbi:hypothetical protein HJG60_008731 [Phyllostomus discolor]|uniref:Uncharacterized protein n=1 Tax=Phyllostomus discolor TaxID=89673 RepID=A0A833YYX7_9CHIR|nr:hypothetical protein HJG60_008731 [Phyllostomus discolor]
MDNGFISQIRPSSAETGNNFLNGLSRFTSALPMPVLGLHCQIHRMHPCESEKAGGGGAVVKEITGGWKIGEGAVVVIQGFLPLQLFLLPEISVKPFPPFNYSSLPFNDQFNLYFLGEILLSPLSY